MANEGGHDGAVSSFDWIRRLNEGHTQIDLGAGVYADILNWAYSPGLEDNVRHRHTYFEVCRVGRYGHGVYIVEDREYDLNPGDLFIARPGVIHQIRNRGARLMELYWVAYQLTCSNGRPMPAVLSDFSLPNIVVTADPHGRVAAVWDSLRSVTTTHLSFPVDQIAAALLWMVAEAFAPGVARPSSFVSESNPQGDLAGRLAIRYIHDNLDQPLDARRIAQHVSVSTRHLSRLVKRITGLPLFEYVMRVRLERACYLLRQTSIPIKEVGSRVGYPHVHHFTRLFSHNVGCPPAAYRKGESREHVRILQKDGAFV